MLCKGSPGDCYVIQIGVDLFQIESFYEIIDTPLESSNSVSDAKRKSFMLK